MAIKIPKGVVFPNEDQLNTDGQVKIPKGVIFPNQALQQKEIEELKAQLAELQAQLTEAAKPTAKAKF